jgi:crotonobetainyl-CoA:carnitine CoA-transferase CaiB-like acyl-CoA transferase
VVLPGVTGGPLAGLVVVDLSRALAGPHAAMMLGDLGARVIKVEAPVRGDDTRNWGPPFVEPPDGGQRESTYFLSCNRNKESITLDLKDDADAHTLARLISHADVLVENFRTGVLDRLGFGLLRLTELNPRLITLSITGFGHDGPEGGRAGYDQIAQGESGIMSVTGPIGGEPTRVGVPIGDLLAGMYGAYGVLAALHERSQTGRGQVVRTSLLAALVGVHALYGTMYTVGGIVPTTAGPHHASICPYGLFHCADGVVQIAVGSEGLWRAFAPAFGVDRPEWATNPDRVSDGVAVRAAIDAAFAPYTRAELMARLAELGVPAGQVRSLDEVYEWDQTRSQGLLLDVEHATLGPITLPGPPLRFDDGGRVAHEAPPTLGQHNDSVRAWLDDLDAPPPS